MLDGGHTATRSRRSIYRVRARSTHRIRVSVCLKAVWKNKINLSVSTGNRAPLLRSSWPLSVVTTLTVSSAVGGITFSFPRHSQRYFRSSPAHVSMISPMDITDTHADLNEKKRAKPGKYKSRYPLMQIRGICTKKKKNSS